MADLWSIGEAETALMAWVLGSVLINALASNLLWFIKDRDMRPAPSHRWVEEAGRLVYYVGIPYLVLGGWPQGPNRGLFSLGDMGIVGLDALWSVNRWLQAAGTGLGWGLTVLLFLVLSWVNANRHAGTLRLGFSFRPWWQVLLDVLFLQVHWAFYRSALTVVMGDPYAGTFVGLGLVYLEWGLNPFWRQGWREKSLAAVRWMRSSLALAIAVLFFASRNLWVCLLVHAILELALRQLGRQRTRPIAAETVR